MALAYRYTGVTQTHPSTAASYEPSLSTRDWWLFSLSLSPLILSKRYNPNLIYFAKKIQNFPSFCHFPLLIFSLQWKRNEVIRKWRKYILLLLFFPSFFYKFNFNSLCSIGGYNLWWWCDNKQMIVSNIKWSGCAVV